MNPKVSVIMAVYNGEKYLKKAVESILNQTFKDFEFLIINDGSTDKSLEILEQYKTDKRVKLLDNKVNKGLIYSLNRGLKESCGEYIARMDADDISYKERLEVQVNFMEQNKDVILAGSNMKTIFEGIPFLSKKITAADDYEMVKIETLFRSTFYHPTVIFRKQYITEYNLKYEDKYKNAEDYGLWTNIIPFEKAININQTLLKYRVVKQSVTRQSNRDMSSRKQIFKLIYKNYFDNLGIEVSEESLNIHFEISMIQNLNNFEYTIKDKENYLIDLKEKLNKASFNKDYVDRVISELIIKIYIYQDNSVKNINKSLISKDINISKRYFIESIKKKIKKVYK